VDRILIGKGEKIVDLPAKYGNRHGLIAGATGSGKTISLMVLAEGFSRLGIGEALVATLQENGVPMPVERTLICPPRCRMGSIAPEERMAVKARSPLGGKYDTPVNRESAYEILSHRNAPRESGQVSANWTMEGTKEEQGLLGGLLWGSKGRQGLVETMANRRRARWGARSAARFYGACWAAFWAAPGGVSPASGRHAPLKTASPAESNGQPHHHNC